MLIYFFMKRRCNSHHSYITRLKLFSPTSFTNSINFAFAGILVCPLIFEDYHQWSVRRKTNVRQSSRNKDREKEEKTHGIVWHNIDDIQAITSHTVSK